MKLSELCKEMEALGRTGSIIGANALMAKIEREYREVEKSLMFEIKGRDA
jgi:hypothetical protein